MANQSDAGTGSQASVETGHSLLDLIKLKERLQKQKLDAQIALKEATLPDADLGRNEQELELLKQEHVKVLANHFTKEHLVKRVQLTTEALRTMFPDSMDPENQQENAAESNFLQESAKSRRLQDLMANQKDVTTEIFQIRERMKENRDVLYELRQRNQEVRQKNRLTMSRIKEVKEQGLQKNKQKQRVAKAEEDLEKVADRITVQRNVFQKLIVGSGLNWAQDEQLLNLVMELSSQPDLL